MRTPSRRALVQRPVRPVRPVRVVMVDVFIKDQPQVPFPSDQHPVQALAPGAGNPALRDRARRPHRRPDDPDPCRREHGHRPCFDAAECASLDMTESGMARSYRLTGST
jgi:hypothetical protein